MCAGTEHMPPFVMRIAYLPSVEAAYCLGDRKSQSCAGMMPLAGIAVGGTYALLFHSLACRIIASPRSSPR